MPSFKEISDPTPLREIIKSVFDTTLPVSGGWGYTREGATQLESNRQKIPLSQFEHMLASMRTYLEMNMTLEAKERYGSINLNELSRETIQENTTIYDKVHYEISAMKETVYADFINEYKEGYGKEDFDLEAHFNRRKKETRTRSVIYWFKTEKSV